jgi:hypothetical protein
VAHEAEASHLPDAYGTNRVMLMARDPHWLYAHWDLTGDQQRRYNASAAGHHLVVRVRKASPGNEQVAEIDLHPESSHWFIHVAQAGIGYVAELGYYAVSGGWMSIGTSEPAVTPSDAICEAKAEQFASVRSGPLSAPFGAPAVSGEAQAGWGRGQGTTVIPFATRHAPGQFSEPGTSRAWEGAGPASYVEPGLAPKTWTPAQEAALEEIVLTTADQRGWISSEEVAQAGAVIKVRPGQAAPAGLQPAAPSSPVGPFENVEAGAEAVSSEMRIESEGARPRGFWFNINAELILYGATEPDARVELARRPVQLRPDGTFSCRFALPDGDYEIDAMAVSKDGDWRRAALRFGRRTEYQGDVGKHPQDPALPLMAPAR